MARKTKNPAAVALGRRGGANSRKYIGKDEASELARKAIDARWEKWRAENPEMAAASEARRAKRAVAKKNTSGQKTQ